MRNLNRLTHLAGLPSVVHSSAEVCNHASISFGCCDLGGGGGLGRVIELVNAV